MSDNYVARQSSSYRHGVVLGLTMAELMLLLVFCLLLALAAYLRFERAKLDAAVAKPDQREISQADRSVLDAVKQNPVLYEKIRDAAATANGQAIDEFWRDLVSDQSTVAEYRKLGPPDQVRQATVEVNALTAKGVDAEPRSEMLIL